MYIHIYILHSVFTGCRVASLWAAAPALAADVAFEASPEADLDKTLLRQAQLAIDISIGIGAVVSLVAVTHAQPVQSVGARRSSPASPFSIATTMKKKKKRKRDARAYLFLLL